jgi:hypothetical protein
LLAYLSMEPGGAGSSDSRPACFFFTCPEQGDQNDPPTGSVISLTLMGAHFRMIEVLESHTRSGRRAQPACSMN